jgi:hypothetical protein
MISARWSGQVGEGFKSLPKRVLFNPRGKRCVGAALPRDLIVLSGPSFPSYRGSKAVSARSTTSSPRPLMTARSTQRLKPFTCSTLIVGETAGLELAGMAVDQLPVTNFMTVELPRPNAKALPRPQELVGFCIWVYERARILFLVS